MMNRLVLILASWVVACHAFTVTTTKTQRVRCLSTASSSDETVPKSPYLNELSKQNPNLGSTRANPARPELPEIPGDYDWDAKYAKDSDWVSDSSQIPGKQVINQVDLARQATALGALEDKWRAERLAAEDLEARNVGWVPKAELINGRTAMFFLVTGLLTEYWTGISLPGQVEEMLRVGGFIGLD